MFIFCLSNLHAFYIIYSLSDSDSLCWKLSYPATLLIFRFIKPDSEGLFRTIRIRRISPSETDPYFLFVFLAFKLCQSIINNFRMGFPHSHRVFPELFPIYSPSPLFFPDSISPWFSRIPPVLEYFSPVLPHFRLIFPFIRGFIYSPFD